MSPTDAGRFTDAATLANLIEHAFPTEDDASVLDDVAGESTNATGPWPPRPVSPARVAASRNAHARPFNDPSNYLG
jgi:hypothetical protein